MKYFSLSLMKSSSLDLDCSSIDTLRCAKLWPGRFQCALDGTALDCTALDCTALDCTALD